jgi:tetratricopeptide (TPR) repeat protein
MSKKWRNIINILTDSYFLDAANQKEAVKYLEKLITYTTNAEKRKKREIFKKLLERNFENVQAELDSLFAVSEYNSKIDQSYFDIQINTYVLQNQLDIALEFIKKYKTQLINYPLWLCRIYHYQSNISDAKKIIDENSDYFNTEDFNTKVTKITVLAAFYLEKTINEKTFQNLDMVKELIPVLRDIVTRCGDDSESKSQMHSILGLIYAVLGESDNATKEYEKALEIHPSNMNALKNYPFILINSNDKTDKQKALEYIKQYLSSHPMDGSIEILYYNVLVFIDPRKAMGKIQSYNGGNDEVENLLLYAYDVLLEYSKADDLVSIFLKRNNVSSNTYFFIGLHYELSKNLPMALEYYLKSFDTATDKVDYDKIVDKLLRLSVFLKDEINIKKCIELIEGRFLFDEIILKYIDAFSYSLLLLHDFEKCYQYCITAFEHGVKTRTVYESLFSCYYNTQNFYPAYEIIEEYLNDFSKLPSHLLQYVAICCIQVDKLNRAYEILNFMFPPESLNEYINKARFLKQIRKDAEALEIAHQAFLAFPKNRQTMELFITLGLNRGDTVISESVAYALHICFDEYLRSDLPNKMITQHTIDVNASPEELLKQISNIIPSSENITSRLDLINDRRLPLFFYKYILGRNMMLVHKLIISQSKGKIWCFDGSFNVNVIYKSACIYVDLCSLLTLDTLDLLNTLPEIFPDILVPQSVFNELRNFESEMPPSNELGFLSKDTSGHVSFSKDDIPYNDILKKAKRIITFLTTTKSIKICGKPLKTVNKLPVEIIKLLQFDKCDFDLDVIQYGYMANCPIMLENLLFRQLFNSISNSPQSFCVIDYLGFLLAEKKIGIKKYSLSLAILSKQNYVCLPFTHHVLIYLIQENGYIIDSHITHIFDSLFSVNYNKRYVYLYVTSTIILLWNMLMPSDIKYKWTNYLFEKFIEFNHLSSFDFDVTGISVSGLIYNIQSRKDFIQYFADFIARHPRISEWKGIKNDTV